MVYATLPDEVGTYNIVIEACLTSFPSQCGIFSVPVTITECVPAVKVVPVGYSSLENRVYVLFSTATFSYTL